MKRTLDTAIQHLVTTIAAYRSLYGQDSWQVEGARQNLRWLQELKKLRKEMYFVRNTGPGHELLQHCKETVRRRIASEKGR